MTLIYRGCFGLSLLQDVHREKTNRETNRNYFVITIFFAATNEPASNR